MKEKMKIKKDKTSRMKENSFRDSGFPFSISCVRLDLNWR